MFSQKAERGRRCSTKILQTVFSQGDLATWKVYDLLHRKGTPGEVGEGPPIRIGDFTIRAKSGREMHRGGGADLLRIAGAL